MTLFKRNFHHVMSTAYFQSYKSVTRGNPNYFITYGNGKSAARVQKGLRPNGAHRWFNYFKHPRCAPLTTYEIGFTARQVHIHNAYTLCLHLHYDEACDILCIHTKRTSHL